MDISHRPQKSWLKVSIETPADFTGEVTEFLASLSGSGVEILPIDEAGEAGERIIAYLAEDDELSLKEALLREFLQSLATPNGGPS